MSDWAVIFDFGWSAPRYTFDLQFVNDKVGWIVGANAFIAKTVDGWQFTQQTLPTLSGPAPGNISILSIDPVDEDIAYAVGGSRTILKTVDGGANWTTQNSPLSVPAGQTFRGIQAVTASTVYILGQNELVLKTVDGGTNWTLVRPNIPAGNITRDLIQLDVNVGLTFGQETTGGLGMIERTDDGWLTWSHETLAHLNGIRAMSFGTSSVGYASGVIKSGYPGAGRTIILKSIDAGISWNEVFRFPTTILSAGFPLYALDADNIYIAATPSAAVPQIWESHDGGNTWDPGVFGEIISGVFQAGSWPTSLLYPRDIYIHDLTTGWASTYEGQILGMESGTGPSTGRVILPSQPSMPSPGSLPSVNEWNTSVAGYKDDWIEFVGKLDEIPPSNTTPFSGGTHQLYDLDGVTPIAGAVDVQVFDPQNPRFINAFGASEEFNPVPVDGTDIPRSAHLDNIGAAVANLQKAVVNIRKLHGAYIGDVLTNVRDYVVILDSRVTALNDMVSILEGLTCPPADIGSFVPGPDPWASDLEWPAGLKKPAAWTTWITEPANDWTGTLEYEIWLRFVSLYTEDPSDLNVSTTPFVPVSYPIIGLDGVTPVTDVDTGLFMEDGQYLDPTNPSDTDIPGNVFRGIARSAHVDNLGVSIVNAQRALVNIREMHKNYMEEGYNNILNALALLDARLKDIVVRSEERRTFINTCPEIVGSSPVVSTCDDSWVPGGVAFYMCGATAYVVIESPSTEICDAAHLSGRAVVTRLGHNTFNIGSTGVHYDPYTLCNAVPIITIGEFNWAAMGSGSYQAAVWVKNTKTGVEVGPFFLNRSFF